MKNTPFILLLLGIAFIWLGLTGRLGAVLAAIFEPKSLTPINGAGGSVPALVVPTPGGKSSADEPSSTPEEPTAPEGAPDIPPPEDMFPGADILGGGFKI